MDIVELGRSLVREWSSITSRLDQEDDAIIGNGNLKLPFCIRFNNFISVRNPNSGE